MNTHQIELDVIRDTLERIQAIATAGAALVSSRNDPDITLVTLLETIEDLAGDRTAINALGV